MIKTSPVDFATEADVSLCQAKAFLRMMRVFEEHTSTENEESRIAHARWLSSGRKGPPPSSKK